MCDVIRLELRKESLKFEQYAKITAYVSKIAKGIIQTENKSRGDTTIFTGRTEKITLVSL